MKQCGYCGRQNEDAAVHCTGCGTNLIESPLGADRQEDPKQVARTTFILLAIILGLPLVLGAFVIADDVLAPAFFNSRIERIGEAHLPSITIERGNIVYCRMKADDFRFPLPPGCRATNMYVTGVFDTADGSIEARFDGTHRITALDYQASLGNKLKIGGYVIAEDIPAGLLIHFHYFGDK